VQGISDLITSTDYVNLDFADVKTVMENQGSALMGIGRASGENRTVEATKMAISSPLLEVSIDGAKQVLLNITGGPDLTLFEAQDASDIVSKTAGDDVNIIFGTSINANMGDEVVVTVIATGIDNKQDNHQNVTKAKLNKESVESSTANKAVTPADTQKDGNVAKPDMLFDPTSIWKQDKTSSNRVQEKVKGDSWTPFSKSEQQDVLDVETNLDDENDIPFFKHRQNN
ncbi:MAG: cell division protein FtsZ, partial [Lactobacillus iners]|nr:cell division protein FtsZ [Lactobacillus iners]